MKILAIRGANLASLAQRFEIDLGVGALAASGLFAIVGNTGAGKSTLLDAMCVALFDRTPRIGDRQRTTVLIGRGSDEAAKVGAHDVRALLRRGAGRGFAEVDFVGNDGRSYRARWEVHRARDRADGALQSQEMSLLSLDLGERLGGTKTETLAAIEERLGLSFDQFRRSALLAQGDFAAFLRADAKDRSELLERMTGTAIYSQLSMAAHRRGQAAEARIKELAAQREGIAISAEHERADLERELAETARHQDALRQAHGALERALDWAARLATLRAELEEAVREHEASDAQRSSSAALRAEHELRRRAEPLRQAWQAAAVASRHANESVLAARALDAAVERAAAGSAAAAVAAQRLEEALGPVRELREELGAPAPKKGELGADEQRAAAELDGLPFEVLVASAREPMEWLAAKRHQAGLAAAWPQLEQLAEREASLRAAAAELERKAKSLAQDAERHAARRAHLEQERGRAGAALEEAKRRAAIAASPPGDRAVLGVDQAARALDAAQLGLSHAQVLAAARQEAVDATSRGAALRARHGAASVELQEAEAALSQLTAEQASGAAALGEAEAALSRLKAAASLAHARAALVEGEPCPLCGATEHPWVGHGAFDDVIVAQEAVVGGLRARQHAAAETRATREAERAALLEQLTTLGDEQTAAERDAHTAAQRWRAALLELGELGLVDDPTSAAAQTLVDEHTERARRAWERARAERSRADALSKAVAEAQALILTKQHDLTMAEAHVASAEHEREQLEKRRAQTTHAAAEKRAAREEVLAALAARLLPFGVTSERALAEAALVVAELRGVVTAWRRHVARLSALEQALSTLHTRASAHAERARTELAVAHASLTAAEEQRRSFAAAAETADAAWRSACAEADLVAQEVAQLLQAPPHRLHELSELLAELERRADHSRSVLDERRRALEAHERAAPPLPTAPAAKASDLSAEQLRELLHATRERATQLEEQVVATRARLARDDADRRRRDELLAQVTAAERDGEVDRALAEVIGSHDGKRLRAFAQSLTLDTLLELANVHLEELAPRYQLERVPRYDLELQVIDRDMGDEVRSVQSLSGGEGFLVSLALALALSSLAAGSVRVRTLLIDEGFGTLDPSTLDGALAVLDALQATGRQVGIISHLPGLVERVTAHVKVVQRGSGRSEVVVPS